MEALEMHVEAAGNLKNYAGYTVWEVWAVAVGEYFEAYKLDKDKKETRVAFETAIKKVKQM